MDVETALALVTTAAASAAGGAATAAGESAWQSLLALGRRVTGRGGADPADPVPADDGSGPVPAVDPGDGGQVRALTARIAERARLDGEFRDALCAWAEQHGPALRRTEGDVHNTVSGNAQITGHLIQARDIQGGINLG